MVGIAAACNTPPPECIEAPTAATEGATGVTSSTAELHGKVNPKNCLTSYTFEYGLKSGVYEKELTGIAGTKAEDISVEKVASGLLPSTTYYYRLTATSFVETVHGGEKSFVTKAVKPEAVTEAATSVTVNSATLNGSVNPKGAETSYYFEYGLKTEPYEKTTASKNAGKGTTLSKVTGINVSSLASGTTYHFRIVANNGIETTKGADKTFKTSTPSWKLQSTPNPEKAKSSRLYFGSCSASTACTSVGEYVNASGIKVPLAERWNGEKWSVQTPSVPGEASASELLGVSCTSGTWCAAAGFYEKGGVRHSLIEAWNGSEWTIQSPAEPEGATSTELSAISCTSNTACTAVGRYTTKTSAVTLAERWDGSKWTVQKTLNPSEAKESSLLAVSCPSGTACIATGYYYDKGGTRLTLAESWNGSEWAIQTTKNRTGATQNILLGVSCTSSTACTAVGGDFPSGGGPQETLVERLSGSEWTIQTSVNPSESEASVLHGVSCASSSSCVAVGDYVTPGFTNVTLAERWKESSWSLEITVDPTESTFSALWSVACASTTECIAPGYYTLSGSDLALTEKLP